MKAVVAETFIEINVECPYCLDYQNRFDDLKDQLPDDAMYEEDIEKELKCVICGKTFIVTDIIY